MIRLVTLGEVMRKLEGTELMAFSNAVGFTHGTLSQYNPRRLEGQLLAEVQTALGFVEEHCEKFGLAASLAAARRLRRLLQGGGVIDSAEFTTSAADLESRLQDETNATFCLSLDSLEAAWYSRPREGWGVILKRFPDAVTDVEEARRCFALERYPAAVFHSCQIIEIGLLDLGKFLSITDPRSGFSAVASKLAKIVKTEHDKLTPFERQHFNLIEQLQTLVEALKNGWRNKISHAQGRLCLDSSEFRRDTAEEILLATRAFMRRLAEELP